MLEISEKTCKTIIKMLNAVHELMVIFKKRDKTLKEESIWNVIK